MIDGFSVPSLREDPGRRLKEEKLNEEVGTDSHGGGVPTQTWGVGVKGQLKESLELTCPTSILNPTSGPVGSTSCVRTGTRVNSI